MSEETRKTITKIRVDGKEYDIDLPNGKVNELETKINNIEARTDVVDVVGSKADLDTYDTTKISANDIVKVLKDEIQSNAIAYYRYKPGEEPDEEPTWECVGTLGAYYTVAEMDPILESITTSIATVDDNALHKAGGEMITGSLTINGSVTVNDALSLNGSADGKRKLSLGSQYIRTDGGDSRLYIHSNSGIKTYGNISPDADNTDSLGASDARFKTIYVSGKLSDGSNELSVNDIKDSLGNISSSVSNVSSSVSSLNTALSNVSSSVSNVSNSVAVLNTNLDNVSASVSAVDNSALHITGDETKTGSLTVTGAVALGDALMLNGSTDDKRKITFDGDQYIRTAQGNSSLLIHAQASIITDSTILPETDDAKNLGVCFAGSTKRFKNLYLSGVLSDGTNELSIEDIKNVSSSVSALDTGKQDKLATQTAYTNKGSATKIPQISTNSLGQVTGITEISVATGVSSVTGSCGIEATDDGTGSITLSTSPDGITIDDNGVSEHLTTTYAADGITIDDGGGSEYTFLRFPTPADGVSDATIATLDDIPDVPVTSVHADNGLTVDSTTGTVTVSPRDGFFIPAGDATELMIVSTTGPATPKTTKYEYDRIHLLDSNEYNIYYQNNSIAFFGFGEDQEDLINYGPVITTTGHLRANGDNDDSNSLKPTPSWDTSDNPDVDAFYFNTGIALHDCDGLWDEDVKLAFPDHSGTLATLSDLPAKKYQHNLTITTGSARITTKVIAPTNIAVTDKLTLGALLIMYAPQSKKLNANGIYLANGTLGAITNLYYSNSSNPAGINIDYTPIFNNAGGALTLNSSITAASAVIDPDSITSVNDVVEVI